jgi:hypothetical protein
MFTLPIYNHIFINISTSIKRNILTIRQSTSGSRSGEGLIRTPGADNNLARPGSKQDTTAEDFEFHISYL